ncbi:MAG: hypothetical protein Q8K62_14620 [Thiobacillus sp.]|nr:hypothetical protein [Thiobacillus sp.]
MDKLDKQAHIRFLRHRQKAGAPIQSFISGMKSSCEWPNSSTVILQLSEAVCKLKERRAIAQAAGFESHPADKLVSRV